MKLRVALVQAIWTLTWLLTGQPVLAQQSVAPEFAIPTVSDPLLRVLASKGLITQEEALTISAAGTSVDQRKRLALLLRDKGILTGTEVASVLGVDAPAKTNEPILLASTQRLSVGLPVAVQQTKPAAVAQPAQLANPDAPAVIPAVAPLRVMPIDPVKREGMYRTRAANHSLTDQGGLFILRGIPARNWHDYRSELGLLFNF